RRTIRNRKDVQEWLHGGDSPGPRGDRRNVSDAHHRLPQTHTFVRSEEECMVPPDWPTKGASESIQSLRRLFQATTVCEPVVRIKRIVTEEVKQRAVILIRSRARDDFRLPACDKSILRCSNRILNVELLRRFECGDAVCATTRGQCRLIAGR